jgi:predicted LPLAT superfamily acyltransferase
MAIGLLPCGQPQPLSDAIVKDCLERHPDDRIAKLVKDSHAPPQFRVSKSFFLELGQAHLDEVAECIGSVHLEQGRVSLQPASAFTQTLNKVLRQPQ